MDADVALRPIILVVDDDESVLSVLAASLKADYQVYAAATGVEALNLLKMHDVAVLLSDQRMPDISGVELAAAARQLRPHLVSIIISAYTDPADMIAAINHGQVFRFLRKPWDLSELLHTLSQAVERNELSRANARLVVELQRRLRALEILQDVLAASSVAVPVHPADVLLERLHEVVPYDLAAMLMVAGREGTATLRLVSRSPVSETNATELRDQALDLFGVCGGRLPEERAVRINSGLRLDPALPARGVGSQAQVPLVEEGKAVGVLVVQSFDADAYPGDVTRLLDLFANRTAQAVVQAHAGAHQQWRLLEQALASLPDAIMLADLNGDVRVANPVARRLLDSLPGTLWELLGLYPEDVVTAPEAVLRREVKLGERVLVAELGRTRGPAPQDARVVAAFRDVTHIEQENAQRRDFLATLSHEVRTPLASVIATLELILAGAAGELGSKQRSYLETADQACDALNHMITNMLELERFSRGGVELRCQAFDPAKLLATLTQRAQLAATARKLTFAVALPEKPITLIADQHRVEQVLNNLLNNACKFSPEGSVVRVTLAQSVEVPGYVVFGIANLGEAIPPEEWPGIFERFRQSRAERRRTSRGTGLGLAISKSIVRAHGGSLLLESGARGSEFWCALPDEPLTPFSETDAGLGPVWVNSPIKGADRIAMAAVLSGRGLPVYLLPTDVAEAQRARQALGNGIVVSVAADRASMGATVQTLYHDKPGLVELATALLELARHKGRTLSVSPPLEPAMWQVLNMLGLHEVSNHAADLEVVLSELPGGHVARLVAISSQLMPNARRRAPVRALYRRLNAAASATAFGIVRFDHLGGFRAAYGPRSETALRRTFAAEVKRLAEERHLEWQGVEQGALVLGGGDVLHDVLDELTRRLTALARVFYRKQDREAGMMRVGNQQLPLVGITTQVLESGVSEAHLLSALGM